jgi:hypothetical protein
MSDNPVRRRKPMPKQVIRLRNVAIATIAAGALALPVAALADQATDATAQPKKHVARTHNPVEKRSEIRPKAYNNAAPEPPGCTWPYRNQFPPCQSTWPAGDPNYHGPRPGPTFE